MGAPKRLLVIGIDGADFILTSEWIAGGHLPNLAKLCESGRLLPCSSTHPPVTAPAWTTAFTGCNPGKHGLYDFWDFSFPNRRPWWTEPRRCPSLWRILSEAGLSCGLVNLPMNFPAEAINGVIISGMGCPGMSEQGFHPRELRQELTQALPEYAFHPEKCGPVVYPDARELARFCRMRKQAAEWLLSKRSYDVFGVVFSSLDWAGHGYARDFEHGGVALEVARAIDAQIGDLLAVCDWPRTPVMVLSDHGMRCARRQANLYVLFHQLGLMKFRWDGDRGKPSLKSALVRGWNLAKRVLPPDWVRQIRRAADRQRGALLNAGPRVRIDWEQTVAAPVGPYGTVRMNVRGRDPQGVVSLEDYADVRQGVVEKLKDIKDPATGRPLFGRVLTREEAYNGWALQDAPDIVLADPPPDLAFGVAFDEADIAPFLEQADVVAPLVPYAGVHSSTGIMILSGDVAATGSWSGETECSLEDFTPTALHVLGIPVPTYMDGRVLTQHLAGEIARKGILRATAAPPDVRGNEAHYTQKEEEELREQLRALGYV